MLRERNLEDAPETMAALYGTIGQLDADMRVFLTSLAPGPGLRCIACGWGVARKEVEEREK